MIPDRYFRLTAHSAIRQQSGLTAEGDLSVKRSKNKQFLLNATKVHRGRVHNG